jgi:hypothetical protein
MRRHRNGVLGARFAYLPPRRVIDAAGREIVRVGGFDGRARQREIALGDVRGEGVTVRGGPAAAEIGTIGASSSAARRWWGGFR